MNFLCFASQDASFTCRAAKFGYIEPIATSMKFQSASPVMHVYCKVTIQFNQWLMGCGTSDSQIHNGESVPTEDIYKGS